MSTSGLPQRVKFTISEKNGTHTLCRQYEDTCHGISVALLPTHYVTAISWKADAIQYGQFVVIQEFEQSICYGRWITSYYMYNDYIELFSRRDSSGQQ